MYKNLLTVPNYVGLRTFPGRELHGTCNAVVRYKEIQLTIEFTYKDKRTGDLFHVTAECYDANAEDFEVEVTNSSGTTVIPTDKIYAEARHQLIDNMPSLEYHQYD